MRSRLAATGSIRTDRSEKPLEPSRAAHQVTSCSALFGFPSAPWGVLSSTEKAARVREAWRESDAVRRRWASVNNYNRNAEKIPQNRGRRRRAANNRIKDEGFWGNSDEEEEERWQEFKIHRRKVLRLQVTETRTEKKKKRRSNKGGAALLGQGSVWCTSAT